MAKKKARKRMAVAVGPQPRGVLRDLRVDRIEFVSAAGKRGLVIWDRATQEAAQAAAHAARTTGEKVRRGASEGGFARSAPFVKERRKLLAEFERMQPIGVNEFCRSMAEKSGSWSFEAIKYHLRIARKEALPG